MGIPLPSMQSETSLNEFSNLKTLVTRSTAFYFESSWVNEGITASYLYANTTRFDLEWKHLSNFHLFDG